MKKITSILMFTLAIATIASCSKIKESPAPETIKKSNTGGGGGGGGGGNPDIWIGLWELTGTTHNESPYTPDSTFIVQLNTGGACVWNWYKPGSSNIVGSESMTYVLNPNASSPNITFSLDAPYGVKTIVNKSATNIVWSYPIVGGIIVKETLTKR